MKILLYVAIGYILWRIVRAMMKSSPTPPILKEAQRSERVETPRAPGIDYSQVRDAAWRERHPEARQDREDDDADDGQGVHHS